MSDSTNDDLNDLKVQWKARWEKKQYDSVAESMISALKKHGSDNVRDALKGIREFNFLQICSSLINFFEDELSGKEDVSDKSEYVYDVPFFCRPREKEKPAIKGKISEKMAVNVTRTSVERYCLKKFIHFQIHFDLFDVNAELELVKSDPVIDVGKHSDTSIACVLTNSLHDSFKGLTGKNDNEGKQKEAILDILKPGLQLCGYDCESFEEPDFKFMKLTSSDTTNEDEETLDTNEDEETSDTNEDEESDIIWGEAKQVKSLPQSPIDGQLSVHLCRYGFATRIARNFYEDNSLHLKRLQHLLNISDTDISASANHVDNRPTSEMSTMVTELLTFSDNKLDNRMDDLANIPNDDSDIRKKMIESAKEVRLNLKEANIGSKDALNLWGATMQACEVSLIKRMKFTVVMSARIMWFVKLVIRDDKCTVLISDSILIGKPGFTQKLIRFVMLADGSDEFRQRDLVEWKENFCDKSENDNKGNSGNNKDRPSDQGSDADDKNDNNDIKHRNKRQKTGGPDCGGHNIVSNLLMTSKSRPSNISRAMSTDNSSSPIKTAESPTQIIQPADGSTNKIVSPGQVATEMGNAIKSSGTKSKSTRMTDEEQMMWQRAFTGLGNANMKYLDQDQDGVIIPYLCQLEGAEVESLGDGRCGTVKKIRWNDGFAAMKEYVLQHEDDPRIPYDVYEHELKVFYRLKSLWGQYVPRLLFHNPWSCRPSIGMEVGLPMDYDFEKWAEADKEKMRETIAKIEEKGFKQDDCRAANFVRLDNGSIAMIDFEVVVEISS